MHDLAIMSSPASLLCLGMRGMPLQARIRAWPCQYHVTLTFREEPMSSTAPDPQSPDAHGARELPQDTDAWELPLGLPPRLPGISDPKAPPAMQGNEHPQQEHAATPADPAPEMDVSDGDEPAASVPVWAHGVVELVPLDEIVLPAHQASVVSTPRSLTRLAASLRAPGRPLPPLPARRLEDGKYELLEGGRLLEAARMLRWTHARLLVVEVDTARAAVWTIVSRCHTPRYRRWDRIRDVRYLIAVWGESVTGRMFSQWTGWHQSDVSEFRRAAEVVTPEVFALAGVNEDLDIDLLNRLAREQIRYVFHGGTEADVALRLREVMNGGMSADGVKDDGERERIRGAVNSELSPDGRWSAEVNLAEISVAHRAYLRRLLLKQFNEACRRMPGGNGTASQPPQQ